MNRLSLINSIFKATNFKTYLEIDCYKWRTFFNVDAKLKIAVDPKFHRTFYLKFLKTGIFNSKFFKMTSDVFFAKQKSYLAQKPPIDVILIDGLHTFKASLKDVFNTLYYLQHSGIVCLNKYHSDTLDVRVIDTDKFISVNAMTYYDLMNNKQSLLNLETVQNFKPILQQRYPEIKL